MGLRCVLKVKPTGPANGLGVGREAESQREPADSGIRTWGDRPAVFCDGETERAGVREEERAFWTHLVEVPIRSCQELRRARATATACAVFSATLLGAWLPWK